MLPDSALGWANAGGLIIAGSTVIVGAISKLTKNKTDDKIWGCLVKIHDALALVGLQPKLEVKRAGAAVVDLGAKVVIDHRKPKP